MKSPQTAQPTTVKPSAKAPKTSAAKKAVSAKDGTSASKVPKTKQAAVSAVAIEADGKAISAAKDEKARRPKKDKVVRDSFTMPKSDYAKIAELKQRCLDAGVSVRKSELLRAGLLLLAAAPAKRLIAAVAELDAVKTGRPARS